MPYTNQELGTYTGSGGVVKDANGSVIASADTITITDGYHHVTGNAVINTINGGEAGQYLVLVADSNPGFQLGGAGNIRATTQVATQNRAMIFKYDGTYYYEALASSTVTSVFGRNGAVVATAGDYTADKITFTPTGTVAAVNCQTAIAEVASEAIHKSGGTQTCSADTNVGNVNWLARNTGLVFNVKAYGATGDGATDDYTAVNAACAAAAAAGGGTVLFPRGIYVLGTKLVPGTEVSLRGEGVGASIIRRKASLATAMIWLGSKSTMSDLTIDGLYPTVTGGANEEVTLTASDIVVKDCEFINYAYGAIFLSTGSRRRIERCTLTGNGDATSAYYGVWCAYPTIVDTVIADNVFRNHSYGGIFAGGNGCIIANNTMEGNHIQTVPTGGGMIAWGGDTITNQVCVGNVIRNPGSTACSGIEIDNVRGAVIANNQIDLTKSSTELLTNGGFDTNLSSWIVGANWAWASSGARHTAGAVNTLSQNVTVTNGVRYYVSFTITGRTAGSISIALGAVNLADGATTSWTASAFSIPITAGATGSVAFTITPTNDFDGTITSVSIVLLTFGNIGITIQSIYNREILVADNVISNCVQGLACGSTDFILKGNIVKNATTECCYINAASHFQCSGNRFDGGTYGLRLNGVCGDFVVTGNVIDNPTSYGMYLPAAAGNRYQITDNSITVAGASVAFSNGYTGVRRAITGNIVTDAAGAVYIDIPVVNASLLFSTIAASAAVGNMSAAEAAFNKSFTLPANMLGHAGARLDIKASGLVSIIAGDNVILRFKVGGTSLAVIQLTNGANNLANQPWRAEAEGIVAAAGAGGSLTTCGGSASMYDNTAVAGIWGTNSSAASVAVDTTATQAVTVTADYGSANANNSITMTGLSVFVSYPGSTA